MLNICDFKNKLVDLCGYTEELAQDVAIMAESLVEYYGETYKDVILDALLSCKICVAEVKKNSIIKEKVTDVLIRENIGGCFDYNEVKDLTTGFFSFPQIVFENGNFKLVGIKRLIVLPEYFNSDSPESVSILAKCCIKLVKSYLSPCSIVGDKLVSKEGVMTTISKLENSPSGVLGITESKIGVGLNKGLNCYDQLCIMRRDYDDTYDVHGAHYERLVSGYFLDGENFHFKDEIRKAEILHDDKALREVFENNFQLKYDEFLSKLDNIAELDNQRRGSLGDNETLKRILDDSEKYYSTEVATMMRGLEEAYCTSTSKVI